MYIYVYTLCCASMMRDTITGILTNHHIYIYVVCVCVSVCFNHHVWSAIKLVKIIHAVKPGNWSRPCVPFNGMSWHCGRHSPRN